MKKIFGLLALIVALNFSAVEARLESVTDNAEVLKPTEVELLNQMIGEVEQSHKIKIGVVLVKSLEGRNIVKTADDLLDQNFSNGMNGSIVLLVDMSARKYEFSTNSRMSERITDSDGIPFLKNKFQPSMSAGNYFGAVNNFVDGVGELMTYYETNGSPYGNQTSAGFDPVTAVLAVVMAMFFGVMIRSTLIGSMSNVHHAMEATDYLKRNTVKFTEKRDTFLFKNVKRRMRSGGGNRGGGGHGGGHGGGGGSF